MKVLWFEITPPSRYQSKGLVIGGWQDSLENIVRDCPDIDLSIAFETNDIGASKKNIDGVTYIPILTRNNLVEKIWSKFSWQKKIKKLMIKMQRVVEEQSPDLIHVFGTEWPFALIQKYTKVPVVVHMQGAVIPYCNALYPPKYNGFNTIRSSFYDPRKYISQILNIIYNKNWISLENEIWKTVSFYMGRTCWDKAVVNSQHPGCTYYHVDEALRPAFLQGNNYWQTANSSKLTLFSTGCSTFWKGPDMLLKTAHQLKKLGIDFSWLVAGEMPKNLKKVVEKTERLSFEDNNITFLGFLSPIELRTRLLQSSLYVHTAYIENSPNSICEAQCLGVPVISTNVGGIESLVSNNEEGILVPANDPWRMAFSIKELAENKEKQKKFSLNGIKRARQRHDPNHVKKQLLNCYRNLLERNTN